LLATIVNDRAKDVMVDKGLSLREKLVSKATGINYYITLLMMS